MSCEIWAVWFRNDRRLMPLNRKGLSQLKQHVEPTLSQCWDSIPAAVPVMNHNWANCYVPFNEMVLQQSVPTGVDRGAHPCGIVNIPPSSTKRDLYVGLMWGHWRRWWTKIKTVYDTILNSATEESKPRGQSYSKYYDYLHFISFLLEKIRFFLTFLT